MNQNKDKSKIKNVSKEGEKYQYAMPKPAEPLGPSEQLVHAAVQVSEGTTAPVECVDQVQIPQGHEEHQIDRASCISKQHGPQ